MKTRKYLTRQEITRLEDAAGENRYATRNRCLIRLCFIHGFRVSELCHLRVSDIDPEARSVYVRRLKNGFSTIHPLVPGELPWLMAWLSERNHWREADSPWLFLSRKGGPLSRGYVYDLFRRFGRHAGLSVPVHPHMLRHACGYALADLGVDTRLIQDYLGHRNISHTVIYTASNPQRFRHIWEERQFFPGGQ